MSNWNRIQQRFDELADQAIEIEQGRKTAQVQSLRKVSFLGPPTSVSSTKTTIDSDSYYQWRTSVQSLLYQVYGDNHPTYVRFAEDSKKAYMGGLHSEFSYLRSLFESSKKEFEGGYLFNLRKMVHSDVFSTELEQAEYFLSEGYKAAAAVIAGTVLEATLRELCNQNSITVLDGQGIDVTAKAKLDRINAELAKASVYNSTRLKQITSWAAIRNHAAHGQSSEYNEAQVKEMIGGITDFVASEM
jgi:hypothetical protein